ncbi:hypothetical protein BKA70DRAFT_1238695 [Coprinopsis sp. MPI-PUGE-AT-0042]|nr:hypothetical protein BKA70DRAFT_1238695 [Coprinopsis sp. MPI-PUGE-AT-0042]
MDSPRPPREELSRRKAAVLSKAYGPTSRMLTFLLTLVESALIRKAKQQIVAVLEIEEAKAVVGLHFSGRLPLSPVHDVFNYCGRREIKMDRLCHTPVMNEDPVTSIATRMSDGHWIVQYWVIDALVHVHKPLLEIQTACYGFCTQVSWGKYLLKLRFLLFYGNHRATHPGVAWLAEYPGNTGEETNEKEEFLVLVGQLDSQPLRLRSRELELKMVVELNVNDLESGWVTANSTNPIDLRDTGNYMPSRLKPFGRSGDLYQALGWCFTSISRSSTTVTPRIEIVLFVTPHR